MQNNSKKTIVLFIIFVIIIGVQFWVSNLNKRADVGSGVVSNTTHEIKGNLNQVNISEYVDSQYGFSIKHPVATEALKDTYFCDAKNCEHEDFVTFTIKNKEGVMPHTLEVARINILKKNTENTISKLSTSFKNKETVSLGGNIFTKGTVSVDGGYTDYLTESNGYIFEIIFYKDKDGKEYSLYPDLSSLNFTKSNDVVLKEYKNDEFSFLYNANASLIEDFNKSGKLFNVGISSVGEINKEMGLYIYFYKKGDSNFDPKRCDKSIVVSNKNFCENDTALGDKSYVYRDGDKEIIIWYTVEDKDALSDNRYIDLSTIQIN